MGTITAAYLYQLGTGILAIVVGYHDKSLYRPVFEFSGHFFRCLVCSLSVIFFQTFGDYLNEIQKMWVLSLG